MDENRETVIKSLQKALLVLNCFADSPLLGVTEISNRLGLYKSNVHSILSTLKAMDSIEQDPDTGKYRLSIAVFTLSSAVGANYLISKIAQPFMQELADQVGERIFLGVPKGDRMVYLDSAYPKDSFNLMRVITGVYADLYCTAIGKGMLAHYPADAIERYLSRPFKAYTEYTITDPEALREELRATRLRGYAIDNMGHEFGVRCVAMPIFDKQGALEAGISISGPASRIPPERLETLAITLKMYVTQIEARL